MKKIIAIAILLASSYGYAQSIELFYDKKHVNSGDTLTINVPNTSMDHYLDIVNTSTNTIKLMVKRTLISLLQGTENSFCLFDCYDVDVDETASPYPFLSGDTLSPDTKEYEFFYTKYDPKGQAGTSLIQYTFYDNDNKLDVTSVFFKFISKGVGIQENTTKAVTLNVYPNPTTGLLKMGIADRLPNDVESVTIYDVVGANVGTYRIRPTEDETVIDISHLAAGLYFLKIDNKVVKVVKE